VGRTLGRRFAGEPIVLYRGSSGKVFALEDRCATGRCRCTSAWSLATSSNATITVGLRLQRKCVMCRISKERLPNGVKSYPAREVDGLIFVFPGDAAHAESRLPKALGASQRRTTRPGA